MSAVKKPGILSIFTSHSFYVRIVTAFVGLLLVTVLPIVSYNYYQNRGIILESADDLMNQITLNVMEKTANFLLPASTVVEISARLAKTGVLSCSNHQQLELYTAGVLKSFPQICMLFLGDEQGNYLRSWRLPDGNIETRIIERQTSPPRDVIKYCDPECKALRTETSSDIKYDPRDRPWYKGAKQTGGNYWTDLYILFRNKKPAVTSAYPLTDNQGKLLGVWGTDIELDEMSDFLKNLKIGKNGLAFIVNEKNEVVAYPDASRIVKEEQGKLRPIRVEELGLGSITTAFEEYVKTGHNKLVVESQGKRYLASIREFPQSFAAPWKVVVVVPEDDFVGGAKIIIRDTVFICLVILLISIFMAILLARAISKPIKLLTEETKKIRDFHLEDSPAIKSRIKEIQLMGHAVSAMRAGLQAFRRYVPAELVRQLVQTGEGANLGGHKRELTVFFSDIAGFTTIAEQLGPEELMLHLSEYFDELTQILSEHRGTVDKYIGDGIMAFWGAPLPDADQASRACQAALLCQEKLQVLNQKWADAGKIVLPTRIGISTGETVVGNVGSSERINYTVMGDNVNLASRLEGANRIYATRILVSQATYDKVADEFWFRPVDIIAVKGKTAETTVYELMGRKGAGETDSIAELCREFTRGFNTYLERNWTAGTDIFARLAQKFPGDAPTALYLSRCRQYLEQPPAADWKGVTYLESK
ncbi:MAG: adenylate/guanylate cyclase domain-containing protein [Deltaproteobacteria bacterium]|nr:adenylate/guanylate cyclase domain-containing protein [Deltaproteobacteria bacterium]